MKAPRGALVWAAAALAVISVGLAAVPLPRRFAGDSGLTPAEVPDRPAAAELSVESILAWSPFGRPADPSAPAQETALGLKLHGVVIATDPAASSAIVSGPGPVQPYAVGQAVTPDAILAEVHGDHVVLLVDGRLETLSFPQEAGQPQQDPGVAALRALVTGAGDAAPVDPADVVAGYRDRIRDDPQALLDELGLAATDQGYQVERPSEDVLRLGLQQGDLVATVNGQQVGNIERDRDLFDEVTASSRVRMEVMRNDQRLVLSFPLK